MNQNDKRADILRATCGCRKAARNERRKGEMRRRDVQFTERERSREREGGDA